MAKPIQYCKVKKNIKKREKKKTKLDFLTQLTNMDPDILSDWEQIKHQRLTCGFSVRGKLVIPNRTLYTVYNVHYIMDMICIVNI